MAACVINKSYSVKCCVLVILLLGAGCQGTIWEVLTDDLLGGLCPLISGTTSFLQNLLTLGAPKEEVISKKILNDCVTCGKELSKQSYQRGNELANRGVALDSCTPALQNFFSADLTVEDKMAAQASQEILMTTKLLQYKLSSNTHSKFTPNTFMSYLENTAVRHKDMSCKPYSVRCGRRKYRSIDGTCNNLQQPGWGRRGAPYTRIVAPRYADGVYSMPVARSGRPLPNPRELSTRLFANFNILSKTLTYLNMQWGQFITHDMMLQVMSVTDKGGIQCCKGQGSDVLPPELLNDKCIPIRVPDNDYFYRTYGIKCLNFVRSITVPKDDCSMGYADQMNSVTSYLDGSTIYGSDDKLASSLRSKKGGRLREELKGNFKRGYLPTVANKKDCPLKNSTDPCYQSGDVRINQTPTLALLHTLFLRDHNRIADKLSYLNPHWNDERLYQESRKIVIATIQHITYQEWLPFNFGESYTRYYQICPSTLHSEDYNPEVNPGAINGFATAAFRFLHSIIPENIMTCPKHYQPQNLHRLSDNFGDPILLETSPDALDEVVRGIVTQSAGESDPFYTAEITNLLFKGTNPFGLDLTAIDIQRGRDHGIASYNDYRELCGLGRVNTFQDCSREIAPDRIYALSQMYESVADIDLLVGGALEREVPGSHVGPTFQCIIAEQFYRTRIADWFFYDHKHSFTTEQLQQLKQSSMSRVICDNSDVQHIQPRAFEKEGSKNSRTRCDDYHAIPQMDLGPWKETKRSILPDLF